MSRSTLSRAKHTAAQLLTPEFVESTFRSRLAQKFGIPHERVFFDHTNALKRLHDAILFSSVETRAREDEIYGETDGETIWIIRGLEEDEYVEVLMHEAMHDSVFILRQTRSGERKGLSCDVEHDVIHTILSI